MEEELKATRQIMAR
jgi:hypothetical protein